MISQFGSHRVAGKSAKVLQVKGMNSRRSRSQSTIRTGKVIDEKTLEQLFRLNSEPNKRAHSESFVKLSPAETINLIV